MKIAIILAFLFQTSYPQTTVFTQIRQTGSLKDEQVFLDGWYKNLNENYFDNKLPKDTQIVVREIEDPRDSIALTTPLGNHKYVISIDPRWNTTFDSDAMSLDHEVCHLSLMEKGIIDHYHGVAFQGCMHRLASLGAMDTSW